MKSRKVNDFIAGLLPTKQPFWIGASRSLTNRKQWVWSDGERWSWTSWRPREPNNFRGKEACGEYWKGWNDIPCSSKKAMVCQTAGKVSKILNLTWPPQCLETFLRSFANFKRGMVMMENLTHVENWNLKKKAKIGWN